MGRINCSLDKLPERDCSRRKKKNTTGGKKKVRKKKKWVLTGLLLLSSILGKRREAIKRIRTYVNYLLG